MSGLRNTRWVDWAVCFGIFVLGLFILAVGEFSRRHGTTPESELLSFTGRATHATQSRSNELTYLRFTLDGQTVDYASDHRGFSKVVDAIREGIPMKIGVSHKRETLLKRTGWVPLYTLSIGDEHLLTYHETVSKGYRASKAPHILSLFLLTIGGWGLLKCFRNRNRIFEPISPQQLAARWNDPKRIRAATILFSVAVYGATLSAILHPDSMSTSRAAFGESPFGLPLRLFLVLLFTALLLPLPIAAWHSFRIIFRSASEGGGFGKGDILQALWRIPLRHQDLKHSRFVSLAVAAFYLALMVAWIWYADSHGF